MVARIPPTPSNSRRRRERRCIVKYPSLPNASPGRSKIPASSLPATMKNSITTRMTTRLSHRRTFLKATALFAASSPFILPGRIWSAETKPNDRIALGFIGMGTQGRGLMGGFLGTKDTQTVAVCDVDTNRRERAKKQVEEHYAKQTGSDYQGCQAYNDFRQLLA